jgi:predicted SnoaL-like aldol condensation-catalyzing enzyme
MHFSHIIRGSLRRVVLAGLCAVSLTPAVFAQQTPDAPLTAHEKANEKLVTDFWREVLQAQNPVAAAKFYAPDVIQHNPNVPTGLQGFQEFFGKIWKNPKPAPATLTPAPAVIMAKGNMVLLVWQHATPDPTAAGSTYPSFSFDLFRIRDGKIVEHWDSALKMRPR